MRTWKGTIAHVGKPTGDGRVVDALYFMLIAGQKPLINAETQEIVGTVDAIGLTDMQTVHGTGSTTLPPGEYSVGMDMDHVNSSTAEGEVFHMDGRFIALHVNRQPAWPDCRITVEDEP
jgi:hypothetical protein